MSNTRNESVELEVTNGDLNEMLNQKAADQPAKAPKKCKNVFSRILAFLLAVAPIALLCLFPIPLLKGTESHALQTDTTLLKEFLAMFGKNSEATKVFGFLPLLNAIDDFGKLMSLALYFIPLAMVVTAIFAIVAIFSGKAAPKLVRGITLINTFVYGVYTMSMWAIAKHFAFEFPLNYYLFGIVGGSFLFYLIYSFVKGRCNTWLSLLLFIFTAAYLGAYVYLYAMNGSFKTAMETVLASEANGLFGLKDSAFYTYFFLGFTALGAFNLFVSLLRLPSKKGLVFDIIRYILNFLLAGAWLFFYFTVDAFKNVENGMIIFIIAAAVAFVQVIICFIAKGAKKKAAKKACKCEQAAKEEKPAEEAKEEEKEDEETVTVVATSYPHTVAEEEIEQAEDPAEKKEEKEVAAEEKEEAPAPQTTAGYDFYNSKSFDPFIASLSGEERDQFTNLFILKCQGEMKNLPDYEVGGDNSDFFRKVFVFLGQYRDRIPDGLLAKMYQFMSKK